MLCRWRSTGLRRKNRINLLRHGSCFDSAKIAFGDANGFTVEDYIDDGGEHRYQTFGLIQGVLVMVAHVYRQIEGTELIWIISARKAVNH